jgi:hypothetical protein
MELVTEVTTDPPAELWRARADWVKGEVLEEGERNRGAFRIAAGVVTLLAAGLFVVAWFHGEIWWFFAVFLAIVAVFLVGTAVRQALQRRKFGASVLHLEATPLALGDRVAGKVRTGIPRSESAPSIRLKLECVHRWESQSGTGSEKRTESHRKILWAAEREVTGVQYAGPEGRVHLAVPVDLALPADQPATTTAEGSNGISWELALHAPFPGLDYRATFTLPVVAPGR